MAKIPLNLKGFKHVSSTNDSTTLMHGDGHTITLAHAPLSPENRAQLKALAGAAKSAQTPMQAQEARSQMKDGGKVKGPNNPKLAESRKSMAGPSMAGHLMPDTGMTSQAAPFKNGGRVQNYYEGSEVQPAPSPVQSPDADDPTQKDIRIKTEMDAEGGRVGMAEGEYVPTDHIQNVQKYGVDQANKMQADQIAASNYAPVSALNNQAAIAAQQEAISKQYEAREAARLAAQPQNPTPQDQGYRQMNAEGGGVKKPENILDYSKFNQKPTPKPAGQTLDYKDLKQQYKDKNRKMYAEGTPDGTIPTNLDPNSANQEPAPQAAPEPSMEQRIGEAVGHGVKAALGAATYVPRKIMEGVKEDLPHVTKGVQGLGKGLGLRQQTDEDVQNQGQAQLTDNTQPAQQDNTQPPAIGTTDTPPTAAAPQPDPYDPQTLLQKGFNNQIAGINQTAQAQGQLGQQQAGVYDQQAQAQQQALSHYQDQYNQLNQERMGHMADIQAGHIDPEKYWQDHSKVASAIGMILGGFTPNGQPNAAINFLKYQMDKNIDAQKANLQSDHNLLNANLQQFHNIKDATDMTRIMQSDVMIANLQKAAANAQTPMAKAAALNAAGQLQVQMAPQFQQFALRRAMMNLANNPNGQTPEAMNQMLGAMRVMAPEQAKEMESRYVPNVGLAQVPVPEDVRNKLVAHQNLAQAATQLQEFIKTHGGLLDRMSPNDRAQAAAMVLPVQAAFREGTLGTVYREGEQPLLDKAVKGQPLDFASYLINTEPTKIRTMLQTNEQQANILKKSYGLPPSMTQQGPKLKKGPDGRMYMRGPNGEAIPVK